MKAHLMRMGLPPLEPCLQPGEEVLIRVDKGATTVVDGPGGFLHLRMWEIVAPPSLGPFQLPGFVWKVVQDFVVGSMGREALRALLNRRAVEAIHVVPGGKVEGPTELRAWNRVWYGAIMAEAATCFSNGARLIKQPSTTTLAEAKAWVLNRMVELLDAEEMASRAVVLESGGVGYELLPSSWPWSGSRAPEPQWMMIEFDDDDDEEG